MGGGRVREVRIEEVSGDGARLRDGHSHLREHVVGEDEGHHGRHHLGGGERRRVWHGQGLGERRVNGVDWKHAGSKGRGGNASLRAHRRPGGGVCRGADGDVERQGSRAGPRVETQGALLVGRLLVLESFAAPPATGAASRGGVIPRTARSWGREGGTEVSKGLVRDV